MTRATALMAVALLAFPGAGRHGAAHNQDGQRLSPVVDVWALQEPATPAAEPEEAAATSDDWSPVRDGALAGAVTGCYLGWALASQPDSDISRAGLCVLGGLFYAGVGAGVGALVKCIRG